MLPPVLRKNDSKAKKLIAIISITIFTVIVMLGREKPAMNLNFNVHIFATANAIINTMVAILLVAALVAVKQGKYLLHKKIMVAALALSLLFLVSYILHHLLSGETKFGGTGTIKTIYFLLLGTHILLAALILPFILFTAYKALTGEYEAHKKLAKITWPLWFYVAITGPIVYLMISPYYK